MILRAEDAVRVAQLKNDTSALAGLLANEFYGTNQNGNSYDKTAYLGLYSKFQTVSIALGDMQVRISGDTAIVTGTTTQVHNQTITLRFVHTWVKRPSGWQLLSYSQIFPYRPTPAAVQDAH